MAQVDPTSLVIGIYGPWGDGKTSVMNLIAESLEATSDAVVVRFNPWQLGSGDAMFQGFFETIGEAIGAKLTDRKQEIGSWLRDYGAVLRPIPMLGDALSEVVKSSGYRMSSVTLDAMRQKIELALGDAGKRVVFLLDDLDRLDKAEIQEIFRLVKVAADFRHTAYVLAFDEDVVANALSERYGGNSRQGSNFLEKIVQLPLRLPPVARQLLRQLTLETADRALNQANIELTDDEVSRFVSAFDRFIMPSLKTPRLGKRYGNALLFTVPMIGKEVDSVDLLLIEAMRIFYPELYLWVRDHMGELTFAGGSASSAQKGDIVERAFSASTEGMPTSQVEAARGLVKELFPRTQAIWGNMHYGPDWDKEWKRGRRITSAGHFARYFTYAVPSGDVSEIQLDELLALASSSSAELASMVEMARSMIRRSPSTFLERVDSRVEALNPQAAKLLFEVLAECGGAFPDREAGLGLSDLDRAGFVASKILDRCSPEDMTQAMSEVVDTAPIGYSVQLFRWVRPSPDDPSPDPKALQVEHVAGPILAARIAALWASTARPEVFGRNTLGAFHIWSKYSDSASVRSVVMSRVEADPSLVSELLSTVSSSSWDMSTGRKLAPMLRREGFDALAEYVHIDRLVELLKDTYGSDLGSGDYYRDDFGQVDHGLAHQFVHIYDALNSDATSPPNPDGLDN